MLLHHFLEYYARNMPASPCLTRGGDSISYGQINGQVNRLANGLLALGVGKGQRVAILGENSLEHLLLLLAAGKIGAVCVPLNYRLAPVELTYILNDSGARVLVVLDSGMLDTLELLRTGLPGELALLAHGQRDSLDWNSWLARQSDERPAVAVETRDACLQLYTSGTTGNPKGVVITQHNVLAMCAMNTTMMSCRPNAGMANVICAPLFHVGGIAALALSIYGGLEIILHRGFDAATVVDDIEKYPVNSIFMVPAMIMAVLALPGIEQRNFSKLRQVSYGASPISEAVLRRALAVFGADFLQMYGMTETTGTVVNLSPADHALALAGRPELLRSCGRPSVGVELKIMDPRGRELPVGEVGEIWIRSDTNLQSYYNLPQETAKNLTDGWVHTGDAGFVDAQGYLFLKDRIKDMVVSGGENIYPVEVENAIAHHEAVADVAVIGVPDAKYGEALLAFVVLREGAALGLEELVAFCRGKIAGYKIPRQLEIIERMPRNPSGKILKKDLRKPYWEGAQREIA
jgi:acyl-CoA synthetase (AMP-forming)/AMP-acid ligase II